MKSSENSRLCDCTEKNLSYLGNGNSDNGRLADFAEKDVKRMRNLKIAEIEENAERNAEKNTRAESGRVGRFRREFECFVWQSELKPL